MTERLKGRVLVPLGAVVIILREGERSGKAKAGRNYSELASDRGLFIQLGYTEAVIFFTDFDIEGSPSVLGTITKEHRQAQ